MLPAFLFMCAVMSAVVEAGAFADGAWCAAAPPTILGALQGVLCMRCPAGESNTNSAAAVTVGNAMDVDAEGPAEQADAAHGCLVGAAAPGGQWVAARDRCLQWGLHVLFVGLPDPTAAQAAAHACAGVAKAAPGASVSCGAQGADISRQLPGDGHTPQTAPLPWGASRAGEGVLQFLQRCFKRLLTGQFSLGIVDAAFRVRAQPQTVVCLLGAQDGAVVWPAVIPAAAIKVPHSH